MFCRQFDCDVRASRGLIRLLRLLAQLGPGHTSYLLTLPRTLITSSTPLLTINTISKFKFFISLKT